MFGITQEEARTGGLFLNHQHRCERDTVKIKAPLLPSCSENRCRESVRVIAKIVTWTSRRLDGLPRSQRR